MATTATPAPPAPAAAPIIGDALLSADGAYRYRLTRTWDETGAQVCFVMLNPSTATATEDDATIRRCIGFARSWGYGSLLVVNLYAYRATKPKNLWPADDPVGPDNDRVLGEALAASPLVIAAWGADARPERVREVLALAETHKNVFYCLKITQGGAPGHPLYIPAATEPRPYNVVPQTAEEADADLCRVLNITPEQLAERRAGIQAEQVKAEAIMNRVQAKHGHAPVPTTDDPEYRKWVAKKGKPVRRRK